MEPQAAKLFVQPPRRRIEMPSTTIVLEESESSPHVWTASCDSSSEEAALVIVLGHLGADKTELERLSSHYTETNTNCAIIAARSPPLDFFLTQHGRLAPIVKVIVDKAEEFQSRRETNPLPILIHMWSNGGAFLWEELLKQQQEEENSRCIFDRLRCVVYDSCPCYLHMPWQSSHYWKDAFPFPGWSWAGRKVYLAGASFSLSAWCLLTLSPRRSSDFWSRMKAPLRTCDNFIYLYSTNDKVTDASRIDELIQLRKELPNQTVTVYRYEDSGHCRLDKDHPEDYAQAVAKALTLTTAT